MALQAALRKAKSKTPSLALHALRKAESKAPSLRTVARNKTTMRVVGSRSSAEDPDALAARLAATRARGRADAEHGRGRRGESVLGRDRHPTFSR